MRAGRSISVMHRLPLACLLVAAACGGPTEPSRPTLKFEKGIVFGIPTLPTTAVAEERSILVTGVLQTVSSSYSLFADLRVTNSRALVLLIDAYDTGPGLRFPTQNYYRARVMDLAPGDYNLQVFHSVHDPTPVHTSRVFNGIVRVQ